MAVAKNRANLLRESLVHTTPVSSSPLRRRSIVAQVTSPINLSENDDEAERNARRRESLASVSHVVNGENRRASLGLGYLSQMSATEISEQISQCIKLSIENKINIKNAFSLRMIDMVSFMLKKQDSDALSFQVASTSLEVSAKIYGYRVDGVYAEMLKMLGGQAKEQDLEQTDGGSVEGQENETGEGDGSQQKAVAKKKKKRTKQNIIATLESLSGKLEIAHPLSMMGDGDTQTNDMLSQVMMQPHANSGYLLDLYNGVITDTIEKDDDHREVAQQDELVEVELPDMETIDDRHICPTLADFQLDAWSEDDQVEETEGNSIFQFDLNASVPHDSDDPVARSFFDIDDDCENVDRCAGPSNQVENIVDFREVLKMPGPAEPSEYSFVQKSLNIHWAGPAHWKIRPPGRSTGSNSVTEACGQAPIRRKKELHMQYDKERKDAVASKFLPGKSNRLQAKTAKTDWSAEKLSLPEDMHYDDSNVCRFNLRPKMLVSYSDGNKTDAVPVQNDDEDYDYANENDISNYCPDIQDDQYNGNEGNENEAESKSEDDGVGSQVAFTDNNLVPLPRLVNKSIIPYTTRPKKIDMRQLKSAIWKSMVTSSRNDAENTAEATPQLSGNTIKDPVQFSEVYKALPNSLSKTNVAALSLPIAFASLLHLANEKNLKISSSGHMANLVIQGE